MRTVLNSLFSVFCLALCVSSGAQSFPGSGPDIRFEAKRIDYGDVLYRKDSVYVYQFVYENTGDAPLIVNQVRAHCPCVLVEHSVAPLPPGQMDTILVYFKPSHASKFTQSMTVLSNAPQTAIQLYAKGNFLKPSEWKARQQQKTDSR